MLILTLIESNLNTLLKIKDVTFVQFALEMTWISITLVFHNPTDRESLNFLTFIFYFESNFNYTAIDISYKIRLTINKFILKFHGLIVLMFDW
jgi:hypothetical protein